MLRLRGAYRPDRSFDGLVLAALARSEPVRGQQVPEFRLLGELPTEKTGRGDTGTSLAEEAWSLPTFVIGRELHRPVGNRTPGPPGEEHHAPVWAERQELEEPSRIGVEHASNPV